MSQLLALASHIDAAVQLASILHRFVHHRLETRVNCTLVQIQYRSWLLHSVLARLGAFTSYTTQQIKNKSCFSYGYIGVAVPGMTYCDVFCIINCKNLKSAISTNPSGIRLNHMQLSVLHIARISLRISRFYHFSGPLNSEICISWVLISPVRCFSAIKCLEKNFELKITSV